MIFVTHLIQAYNVHINLHTYLNQSVNIRSDTLAFTTYNDTGELMNVQELEEDFEVRKLIRACYWVWGLKNLKMIPKTKIILNNVKLYFINE